MIHRRQRRTDRWTDRWHTTVHCTIVHHAVKTCGKPITSFITKDNELMSMYEHFMPLETRRCSIWQPIHIQQNTSYIFWLQSKMWITSPPKVIWEESVVKPHGRECTRLLRVLAVHCPQQTSPVTQPWIQLHTHRIARCVLYFTLRCSIRPFRPPPKKICPSLTGDMNPLEQRKNKNCLEFCICPDRNFHRVEQGLTSHQTHYRSYRGRVFMGQMTQPTVPKHWRKIGPKD